MGRRHWRTFSRRLRSASQRAAIPEQAVALTIVVAAALITLIWGFPAMVKAMLVVLITGFLWRATRPKYGVPVRITYATTALILLLAVFWNWYPIEAALKKIKRPEAPKELAVTPSTTLAPAPQIIYVPVPVVPTPPPASVHRLTPAEKCAMAYERLNNGTYFPPTGTPK